MAGLNDEYGALLDEETGTAGDKLARTGYLTADRNPEQESTLVRISQRSGIPVEALRLDGGKEAERQAKARELQMLPSHSPGVARFLSSHDNASVAHDDWENLSTLEKAFQSLKELPQAVKRTGQAIASAFESGQLQQEQGRLLYQHMLGDESLANAGKLVYLGGEVERRQKTIDETKDLGLLGAAQIVGQMWESGKKSLKLGLGAGMTAGGVAAVAGQVGPQVALPEEIITVPAAFSAAFGAGATYGMLEDVRQVEAGQAYQGLLDIRGANGEQIDKGTAATAASLVGVVNSALEGLGLKVLSAPVRRLLRREVMGAATQAVEAGLVQQTMSRATTRFGKDFALGVGAEVGQEVAQEISNVVAEEVSKAATAGEFDEATAGEIGARLWDVAWKTASGMAWLGLVPAGAGFYSDAKAARAAQTSQEFFSALGDATQRTKLKERLPDKLAELVDQITEGGDIQHVYAPAAAWSVFWQERGMDPATVAATVGVSQQEFQEAVATGGDITIPLSQYTAKIAGTEHHGDLSQDLRVRIGDMTAREAEEFEAQRAEQVQRLLQEANVLHDEQGGGTLPSHWSEGARQVYEDVRGQLLGAKLPQGTADVYAKLWAEHYQARSEQTGKDAGAKYQEKPLNLRNDLPTAPWRSVDLAVDPMLDTLRAGKIPSDSDLFGPSLTKFLLGIGGLKDTGGELKSMDAKGLMRNKGLGFDRAREAAVEAGYLPEESTITDFLEAIAGELKGSAVYSPGNENGKLVQERLNLEQTKELLDRAGLDLSQMSNEEVRRRLDQIQWQTMPPDLDKLPLAELGEFKSGEPVTFSFIHNKQSATTFHGKPKKTSPYDRWFEPSGRYVNLVENPEGIEPRENIITGELTFQNPLVIEADNWKRSLSSAFFGLRGKNLSQAILDAGYDGVVTVEKDRRGGHLGEILDLTTFDAARALYQTQGLPRLIVNLENLIYADEMGGLAVPSLAVTPEGVGHESYGDITLIGTEALGNPEKEAVLDSDAYTATFPQPEYPKVPMKVAQKVVDEFRPYGTAYGESYLTDSIWDNAVNYPNPAKTLEEISRYSGVKAKFLHDVLGVDVAPVMTPAPRRFIWTGTEAWRDFAKGADWDAFQMWDDPRQVQLYKEAGKAAVAAVKEYFRNHRVDGKPLSPSKLKNLVSIYTDGLHLDEDGAMAFNPLEKARRDYLEEEGAKTEIDKVQTAAAVDKELAGHEAEFKSWMEKKILGMYGEPFLKVNGKKKPYSLDYIVAHMTNQNLRASEKNLTFGTGAARAAAAHQFRNLEEMRQAAAENILPKKELDEFRKKAEALLEEYRNAVTEYYKGTNYRGAIDVWNALDDSMKAIARWAKGPRTTKNLQAALSKEYFKPVPEEILSLGVTAGNAMLKAPVPYFEAKPQRAVKLSEFAGAVVPDDASPEVLEILKKNGIAVKKYGARFDEEARHNAAVQLREELQAKGDKVLFQSTDGRLHADKLGYFIPGGDRIDIGLLPKADLSTFLHETGHAWLEELRDDAMAPDAPDQVKADWQTAKQKLGIAELPDDAPIPREAHELWADSFLAYLQDGKAPSESLRVLFRTFKKWLKRLVSALRVFQVDLTPEVRGVFDRLLASEASVTQARAELERAPIFATPEEAGMSPEMFEAYRKDLEQAHEEAVEHLEQATMRELLREQKAWWKERKEEMTAEVQAEAAQTPVYRVFHFLATGEMLDGTEGPAAMKLNRTALVASYGEEFVKRLPRGFGRIYAAEGGVSPSLVAELFGFESSDEMIRQVVAAPSMKKWVAAEVTARMNEQYGNMMLDGSLSEEAVAAVHSEGSARVMRAEIRALRRKEGEVAPYVKGAKEEAQAALEQAKKEREYERRWMAAEKALAVAIERGARQEEIRQLRNAAATAKREEQDARRTARDSIPSLGAFREAARLSMATRTVGSIFPDLYAQAERKAAREAYALAQKKDYAGAAEAKRRQMLNFYMYREADQVNRDMKKALEGFKRVFGPDEKLAKSRNIDLVNAARAILGSHGIGPQTESPLVFLEKVRQYNPQLFDDLQMAVDVATQGAVHYSRLSTTDFFTMKDAVDNLWHLSRRERLVEIDGALVAREEVIGDLAKRLDELGLTPDGLGSDRGVTMRDRVGLAFAGFKSMLRRVEHWTDAMDGGTFGGPFRRYIWQPVSEGADRYRADKAEYIKRFRELFTPLEESLAPRDISAPELGLKGYTFRSKAELLGALLHTGNESNLAKLLVGRKWGYIAEDGGLETGNWEVFLRRMIDEGVLTKADYDFVQSVWDLLEELKPQAQAVHRDMYGYYFSEITAHPVETPWGLYKGGYFPAATDPFIVSEAAIREGRDVVLENSSRLFPDRPTTGRGFTKSRVENYRKALSLDMRLAPVHIDKVLRFIHLEPRVKDVTRIITDQGMADMLDQWDKTLLDDMLMPWLERSAKQSLSSGSKGFGGKALDKVWQAVRRRTGLQTMVLNVTNSIQQLTGLSISMLQVDGNEMRRALWSYVRAPGAAADFAAEHSPMMAQRVHGQVFHMMSELEQLLDPNKFEKLKDWSIEHGYFLQRLTQDVTDVVTWLAGYNGAIAEGVDEKEAVRRADSAVRETQGSYNPEDISRSETGSPFVRLFTQFYSYFNMQANVLGAEFVKTVQEYGFTGAPGRLFYVYLMGFMIPAFLSELLVRVMSGRLDDDEDDDYLDDVLGAFFMGQVRSGAAMVPVVGQATMATINMANHKPYDDRLSTSPAVSAIESSVRTPMSVKRWMDGGSAKVAVRDGLTLLGMLTGHPAGALARPLGYLANVEQGREEPAGLIDLTRGMITGR